MSIPFLTGGREGYLTPCDRMEIRSWKTKWTPLRKTSYRCFTTRLRVQSQSPTLQFPLRREKFSKRLLKLLAVCIMAGLSSSTTKRAGGRNLGQQPSSNENMAEILRAWDDEDDEMVEFMADRENLSSAASRNANGSSTGPRGSPKVATYSPSTVRVAKTLCLYVSFFGLVSMNFSLIFYSIEFFCVIALVTVVIVQYNIYTARFNKHKQ